MKKRVSILFSILAVFSAIALAAPSTGDNDKGAPKEQLSDNASDQGNQDSTFVQVVEKALEAVRKEAPDVHERALKVWQKFDGTGNPNFTYRFWGRSLILWLRDHKKVVFDSAEKVRDVFGVLLQKGLISKHAAATLTVDAWGHLVYLEGAPALENRTENRKPGGEMVPGGINQKKSETAA